MSKIQQNQIIAIEKGVKNRAKTLLTDFYKAIQKPALFSGKIKKFEKINDDTPDLPDENVKVQMIASEMINKAAEALSEYFDVSATKDWGNCVSKASVIVDGQTIIEDAPVTYLLFLEKELADLHTFVGSMPTLDTSFNWSKDQNSNLFKSDSLKTQRTAKVQRPVVLYEATKEHPAQTQLITEDRLVGYWNSVEMSGALPIPEKESILKKIEKLQAAVKSAREKGNSCEIEKQSVSGKIFSYLFK